MKWFVFFMVFSVSGQDYGSVIDFLYSARQVNKPNYNQSYFNSLENYQVNAAVATENQYPWIARLVHSTSSHLPHMCTAVCVEYRIFITAARCLIRLKVTYTRIIYQNHHFPSVAFVLPSNPTKQAFDDIGFVVVNDKNFHGQWISVELYNAVNRTDDNFDWFANLKLSQSTPEHFVLGYATQKGVNKLRLATTEYSLTKLEVVVHINICPEIIIYKNVMAGFHVPCYYSCSVAQYKAKDPKCSNYHGVVGGALLNMKTKKLFGITTWGEYYYDLELPVGFSVPNSENFFKDYTCARRIKEDKGQIAIDGYYQALCDNIN